MGQPQTVPMGTTNTRLGATYRSDTWWVEPLVTALGFLAFVCYATWAALQGSHYYAAPYLSPFYAPLLFVDPTAAGAAPLEHAWFGTWPSAWPSWIPASPSILILGIPLSFRLTCYYARKFYYRSYFGTPPACAVGAMAQNYKGETGLLIIQNLHRYTLYLAILAVGLHFYDSAMTFYHDGKFGIGVGSVILLTDAVLLSMYVFGCHAWRHIIAGGRDSFSCADGCPKVQYRIWQRSTWLNERHMLFFWLSLIWIAFCDLYVRMVSMGIIHDWNTWN